MSKNSNKTSINIDNVAGLPEKGIVIISKPNTSRKWWQFWKPKTLGFEEWPYSLKHDKKQ